MPTGVLPLKRRKQFLNVAAAGQYFAARGLLLQVSPNHQDSAAVRVGYTASRKVGNAVARNRAKRRMRALAVEIMPFNAKIGYDYVIIARTATANCSFGELGKDLKTAMIKLDVWRNAGPIAP